MATLHKDILKQPFFWTSILCSLLLVALLGIYAYAWVSPTGSPNSNANAVINLDSSGNVGIGTATPGAKLEVAGQVKITGGNPASGKVLTSDDSGLASWQTVTGGGGDVMSVFGRTGTVTAQSGDYTTSLVSEGSNLYFTNARAVAAVQSALDAKAPTANPTFTGSVTMPGTGVWNSSGNVGIGMTPTHKLDVSGDLYITGNTNLCTLVAYTNGSGTTTCPAGYYTWSAVGQTNGYMLCCKVSNPI
ncbi:MAG TPA: hypothetical protein PK547_00210 [Candidatus Paceibacterota bacterium]|nr:hypothetical protein [Candidatus Paceibacterota bacterium]HPR91156.1 hypothetical protein [Candidatus Paceibacterota bacterium]